VPSVVILSAILLSVIIPSVVILSAILLRVIMPSVDIQSIIMFSGNLQSVIMVSVVAPPSGDFFTSVDYFSFEKTSFDLRCVYTGDFAVRFRNAFLLVQSPVYTCNLQMLIIC
jgi:hypothetical protein